MNTFATSSELNHVIQVIAKASVEIERYVRYQAIYALDQNAAQQYSKNSSGDEQQKLDIICHNVLTHHLIQSKACNVLLSEEADKSILVPKESRGTYLLTYDPLDGSSNIDCNGPVGTIVGIFENKEVAMLPQASKMVAALYVLYGPATELIIAVDQKVSRYVMDSNKTYVPMGPLSLKGKFKKVYSINEGNHSNWDMDIKQWIEGYKQANYSARYIGSMVGDVHRTLLYGGSFCYPADKKNKNGKLRLLYEAWPMAMIIETAGGRAVVGNRSSQRILDVPSTELHQRTPILLGSAEEVARYDMIRSKL